MKVSVIIPVFNEQLNVAPLYSELAEAFKSHDILSEIIFINDASTDETLREVNRLAQSDSRVGIINLAVRRGQSYATMQGIQTATGELIAFLDGDLQNDARDLPRLIEQLSGKYDLVCGWRADRKDKKIATVSSRIANFLIRIFFGIDTHDVGCSLRVTYSKYVKQIKFFENFHRYIPVILSMQNLKIAEIVVNHRERASGESKYTIFKTFSVIKELLYLRLFY